MVPPQNTYNIATVIWDVLDDAQKTALNADMVARAGIQNIRIIATNSNTKFPYYSPTGTTAENYFKRLKSYFASQNFKPADHKEVMGTILQDKQRLWLEANHDGITTWNEFEAKFKAKADTYTEQRERIIYVNNRRQHLNEPLESFVYDMKRLIKQISPGESENASSKSIPRVYRNYERSQ